MQMRLAAQAQGLGRPLANAAASGRQEVRNPRTEGPRHETGNVDAPGKRDNLHEGLRKELVIMHLCKERGM